MGLESLLGGSWVVISGVYKSPHMGNDYINYSYPSYSPTSNYVPMNLQVYIPTC